MNIVLIGPHGVGKTSVGRELASVLGIPFHEELGWKLARDPRFRPEGRTAADSQEAFDEAVFREELRRDEASAGTSRVIETWHPGNLAYAAKRSPRTVSQNLSQIVCGCRRHETIVIPLVAPMEDLAARQHEPGPLEFFIDVGRQARRWAERLELMILTEVETQGCSPRDLAEGLASSVFRKWEEPCLGV